MKKKKVFLGATVVAAMFGMTACSTPLQDAQNNISSAALNALNTSEVAKEQIGKDIAKYKFLGANISGSTESYYDVEVCGVTESGTKQRAYTTMYYTVPTSNFDGVKKNDSASVINGLANVISSQDMQSVSYCTLNSFTELNAAVKSQLESPVKEFSTNACLVYGVSNLNFNYEDGYASFTTYEDTKYSRTRTELVYTVTGVDAEGNFTYGYTVQTVTDYESFIQEHNMYVKATQEELDAMQQDNSLVFDKFTTAVKNGQKDMYTVQSVNVQKTTEFNTNLLGQTDYSL